MPEFRPGHFIQRLSTTTATFKMASMRSSPAGSRYAGGYTPPSFRLPERQTAQPPRPQLAVRVLPGATRDASLALIEDSLPRLDRRLRGKAADFMTALTGCGARALHAEGVDPAASLAGSHAGFTALVEAAGKTPDELEALVTGVTGDLPGDDPEAV